VASTGGDDEHLGARYRRRRVRSTHRRRPRAAAWSGRLTTRAGWTISIAAVGHGGSLEQPLLEGTSSPRLASAFGKKLEPFLKTGMGEMSRCCPCVSRARAIGMARRHGRQPDAVGPAARERHRSGAIPHLFVGRCPR
jgi:hypothetical protein